MKNTYKSIALLFVGLAATACVEEQFEDNKPVYDTTPGNEIVFTATAAIKNSETKTVYGDVVASNGKGYIEINWDDDDCIQIASPHTAGTTSAKYKVNSAADNDSEGDPTKHSATSLTRIGDVGLQWSNASKYDFYAMYPSPDTFTDGRSSVVVQDETVVMNGHLPVEQGYAAKIIRSEGGFEFTPNMNYAYMVASDAYNKDVENSTINLDFTSLVTALQFEIKTGTITNADNNSIYISQVVLYSESGKSLAGDFTYDFNTCTPAGSGANTVTVSFAGNDGMDQQKGLLLTSGQVCDVTFFILPSYTADMQSSTDDSGNVSRDLKLKVVYYLNGAIQTKTATVGKDIIPTTKTYFKNLVLPNMQNIEASSWFDILDPNTPVAELSIPVAGNVFSYAYNDANTRQQVLSTSGGLSPLQQFWNMGVRGFEFRSSFEMNTKRDDGNVTSSSTGLESGTYTVADEKFICGGQFIDNGPTFSEAFDELYGILQNNKTETAVVIATYQSKSSDFSGGFSPLAYIRALETYLTSFCTEKNITDKSTVFAKLTTNSVVSDIQGRIVVIVRPGDDDYIRYERNNNSSNNAIDYEISALKPTSAWEPFISVIPNWGTAQDQWDKRYGAQYLSGAIFSYSNNNAYTDDNESRSSFESEYLRGSTATLSGPTKAWPTEFSSFWKAAVNYDNEQPAFIQSWERVVPKSQSWQTSGSYKSLVIFDRSRTLYYYWPESLSQKKRAITDLMSQARMSPGTVNEGLYINSLSGYFPINGGGSDAATKSTAPYVGKETISGTEYTINSDRHGDYSSCAAELNYFLWSELTNPQSIDNEYGPLGLMILDYIGAEANQFGAFNNVSSGVTAQLASEASKSLPGLILMNNFKVKPTTGE